MTTVSQLQPLTIPAPDATMEDLRAHFISVGTRFAAQPFDINIQSCKTCCTIGENTLGKDTSRSGRACFDTEACMAIWKRYNATALAVVSTEADDVGEEDSSMPKPTNIKTARKKQAAPSRVQAAPRPAKEKPAAKPKEAKPAKATVDPTALKPGTKLEAKHKGKSYSATVTPEGIKHADKVYKSLTAAALAITGVSVNGRRFWNIAA